MHFPVILRITGLLLMLFSTTMLTPLIVAAIFREQTLDAFGSAFLITFISGFLCWLPVRQAKDLRTRDGFMVTVLFYVALGLFGAIPIWFAGGLGGGVVHSFTDAAFESISGLTTTGATTITGLDQAPKSLLFYRQQLQWLGGMGIVVLAVAILPMLGIGGMQLYKSESPGPVKDTKLTPRITETAKALWYIYLTLTLSCAGAYWVAGMSVFDAICHAFSTVAIGGFSTHDASMGWFDSALIESIAVFFMVLSGINFGLHFVVWRRKRLGYYLQDPEVRFYLMALLVLSTVVVVGLLLSSTMTAERAVRDGIFQVVSIMTTTGFTTTNFSLWPNMLPALVFLSAFAGGCAGSTAGGLKIIRVLLIYLQGFREVRRLIHPNGVFPVKLGRNPVPDRVIEAVWGFFSVYVIVFLMMLVVLQATGLDFISAFSAVGACLNNLGPGLGDVALNYGELGATSKWVLCLVMLMGRLEIFTLLVLFTPDFWRR